jgi:hypothetical protein
MSLEPEQRRALRYLKRKGTDATVEAVHLKIHATFRHLESLLDELDESETRRRRIPESWSVHEIVDHLIESHRPAAAQLHCALAGVPAGEAIPPGLQSADPFSRSWPELLIDLKKVHREFDMALTSDRDIQTDIRIPIIMVVKTEENGEPIAWHENLEWKAFAMAFRAHTLEHIRQIERTFAPINPD